MGLLKTIFGKSKQEKNAEDERINSLIERATKASPIAADVLKKAQDNGVSFVFDDGMKNAVGAYNPLFKKVCLSSRASDETLLTTIVHESRHATQKLRKDFSQDLKSAIQINRAQEADAMAVQCAAAFEMRRSEPDAFLDFSTEYNYIMWGFQKNYEKTHSMDAGIEGAFKSWYENDRYISSYDERAVDFMRIGKSQRSAFTQNVPEKDIADALCRFNGKRYIGAAFLGSQKVKFVDNDNRMWYIGAAFLGSQKATTVHADIAKRAELLEKKGLFGILRGKENCSTDYFFLRNEDGTVHKPKRRSSEETEIIKAALRTKGRNCI